VQIFRKFQQLTKLAAVVILSGGFRNLIQRIVAANDIEPKIFA